MYSPNCFGPKHDIFLLKENFWYQKVAQPVHVDNATEKWFPNTPTIPEPLQGKHKTLKNLTFFQLNCKKHKPILGDINQKNHTTKLQVATTLVANMAFNTVNLLAQFPRIVIQPDCSLHNPSLAEFILPSGKYSLLP